MPFKNPPRSITWPPGARTGDHRIVVGADTPPELSAYGMLEAVLWYIVDENPPHDEIGYFFMGQINTTGATRSLAIGNVRYPTAGDPSSPTFANVHIHTVYEIWDNTAGEGFTFFQESSVVFEPSVPFINIHTDLVQWLGTTGVNFMGVGQDVFFIMTGGAAVVFDPVPVFFTDGQILFDNSTIIVSNTATMEFDSGTSLILETGSIFTIDGRSAERGLMTRVSSVAGTGAIGAEAVILTLPSATYRNGRAYRFRYKFHNTATVLNSLATAQVRRTNLAGVVVDGADFGNGAGTGGTHFNEFYLINNTGANIARVFVLTLQSFGGGTVTVTGAANFRYYFESEDCGAAADFAGANVI